MVDQEWYSFLLLPKAIPFHLRLRYSDRISSRTGQRQQKRELDIANLKVGDQRVLSGKRWVWGRRVYVVATRLEDGELQIVTTAATPDSVSRSPLAVGD